MVQHKQRRTTLGSTLLGWSKQHGRTPHQAPIYDAPSSLTPLACQCCCSAEVQQTSQQLRKYITEQRYERHLSLHGSLLPLFVEARVRTPSRIHPYEVILFLAGIVTPVLDCRASRLARIEAAICRAMPVGNLCCSRPTQAYSYHQRLLQSFGSFQAYLSACRLVPRLIKPLSAAWPLRSPLPRLTPWKP